MTFKAYPFDDDIVISGAGYRGLRRLACFRSPLQER